MKAITLYCYFLFTPHANNEIKKKTLIYSHFFFGGFFIVSTRAPYLQNSLAETQKTRGSLTLKVAQMSGGRSGENVTVSMVFHFLLSGATSSIVSRYPIFLFSISAMSNLLSGFIGVRCSFLSLRPAILIIKD